MRCTSREAESKLTRTNGKPYVQHGRITALPNTLTTAPLRCCKCAPRNLGQHTPCTADRDARSDLTPCAVARRHLVRNAQLPAPTCNVGFAKTQRDLPSAIVICVALQHHLGDSVTEWSAWRCRATRQRAPLQRPKMRAETCPCVRSTELHATLREQTPKT